MKRTLENCALIKRIGKPKQYDGKCEGMQRSEYDDEPCDTCQNCPLYYLNTKE